MAQFTRFKPTRDAFLFGWAVLGEDFLSASTPTVLAPGGGGFGAVMAPAHTARYAAYAEGGYRSAYRSKAARGAYRGGYKPAYKPLATPGYRDVMRKQKP